MSKKIRYNPYKRYNGIMIPDGVWNSDLHPYAKLIFGRLLRFAGKDGKAYPNQKLLGEELGVDKKTIRKYLKQLEEVGLIEWEHTLQNNNYYFLEHYLLGSYNGKGNTPTFWKGNTPTQRIKESHKREEDFEFPKENSALSKESPSHSKIKLIFEHWNSLNFTTNHKFNPESKLFKTVSKYINNLLSGYPLLINKDNSINVSLQKYFNKVSFPDNLINHKYSVDEIIEIINMNQSHKRISEFFFIPIQNTSPFYSFVLKKYKLEQPTTKLQSKIASLLNQILHPKYAQEHYNTSLESLKMFLNSKYKVDEKEALKILKKYLRENAIKQKYAPKIYKIEDFFEKYSKLQFWYENNTDEIADDTEDILGLGESEKL